MPGLLAGIARTAVVAGTATAVSNRVSRRQAGRWAEQDQQAYQQQAYRQQAQSQQTYEQQAASAVEEQTPGGNVQSMIGQLKELAELKEQGILTEAEFAVQKSRLLGS
jgi:outer membrane PBP1 activator LpoA protein